MAATMPFQHWRARLSRSTRDDLFLLAIISVLALQMSRLLPNWAGIFAMAILAWRMALAVRDRPMPPRWMLVGLLLVATCGVLLEWSSTGSISGAALTLLLMLLALKTLEMKARRDAFVLFFLGFFCIVTNFLYSQLILVALLMLLVFWGLLTALVNAHRPVGPAPLWESARTAAKLVAIGIPLIAALYLFFPRLPPLWGMPNAPTQGSTGLSGQMDVGSIADLAQNRAVALRLQFQPDSARPRQAQMYFRGPVLSYLDGRTWRARDAMPINSGAAPSSTQNPIVATGQAVRYQSVIEPHRQRWLLPLEVFSGAAADPGNPPAMLDQELVWNSYRPINSPTRYLASSQLEARYAPLARQEELAPYLQLPQSGNAQTRAWAQVLREQFGPSTQNGADKALAEHVLQVLHQEDYHYTLQPPIYGGDTADEFWFVHRSGFCEHIASAYAILLRAAGVPARIVTGYQGGEPNPIDGVWTVRQSDAHAWVEAWLPGEGWTRLDPTAAIAPERIHLSQTQAAMEGSDVRRANAGWLMNIQSVRDAIDYRWTQWVLNYDRGNQASVLEALGLRRLTWAQLALVAIAIAAGIVAAYLLFPRLRRRRDPWQQLLEQTRLKLAKAGLHLPSHMPPRRMADAVQRFYRESPEDVSQWLLKMDALRYAPHPQQSMAELARAWRRLKWPNPD